MKIPFARLRCVCCLSLAWLFGGMNAAFSQMAPLSVMDKETAFPTSGKITGPDSPERRNELQVLQAKVDTLPKDSVTLEQILATLGPPQKFRQMDGWSPRHRLTYMQHSDDSEYFEFSLLYNFADPKASPKLQIDTRHLLRSELQKQPRLLTCYTLGKSGAFSPEYLEVARPMGMPRLKGELGSATPFAKRIQGKPVPDGRLVAEILTQQPEFSAGELDGGEEIRLESLTFLPPLPTPSKLQRELTEALAVYKTRPAGGRGHAAAHAVIAKLTELQKHLQTVGGHLEDYPGLFSNLKAQPGSKIFKATVFEQSHEGKASWDIEVDAGNDRKLTLERHVFNL